MDGADEQRGDGMKLEDCLWAVIERHEDGTVICPLLETGGRCEECMEIVRRNHRRRKKRRER